MKVILLMDVARLGKRMEVKEVPDGHALNFLIPRKLAEPATKENLKRIEERVKKVGEQKAHTDEVLHETLGKLKDSTVKMAIEANEQGSLFKGLKAADVAAHIASAIGPIGEGQLSLKTPIKAVGDYQIEASVGDVKRSFTLKVVKK
jgi:large subunit ribosomal protein L9